MSTAEVSSYPEHAQYTEIRTVEELRELIKVPDAPAAGKVRSTLHEYDRAWLARSPLCVMATADGNGWCDASPKGDPAGFVKILDDTTIAIPERPGNRRADGYLNILQNPRVGLLFVIPGRSDTLRLNGRAKLVKDAPFFEDMLVKGHRPTLAVIVEIEEVFFHCAKSFLRSATWKPETWEPESVPSTAQIAKATTRKHQAIEEIEAHYGAIYGEKLYEG
ncbi:pyridoxamine 5'-phosphate oxidase family protein [Streptomyces sp. KLOTTS4A1]|uniref:pyridoxamine 5'-phosphate oxidase family protein n=1 Tax=Streptomyces sp. KLOTTS4A1 TaxID=3390996 RepID=UPI0039F5D76A